MGGPLHRQIYVTEQSNHAIESGPSLTFTDLIPDVHHYNSRSGKGHALYRDNMGISSNLPDGLLEYIALTSRAAVSFRIRFLGLCRCYYRKPRIYDEISV